jgi:hypothetical protein
MPPVSHRAMPTTEAVEAQKVRDVWMSDGVLFSSSLILFAVGLTKAQAAVSPPIVSAALAENLAAERDAWQG